TPSFKELVLVTSNFLNEAIKSDIDDDILATQIMVTLCPRLIRAMDSSLEDTFVHACIDPIIDSIFSHPLLQQRWANGKLQTTSHKPDFVLYFKPWITTYEIMTMEVKSYGKRNTSPPSDFVKLGLEMKHMLATMADIENNARAYGILVEGR
ncbi:hypothetical protein DM01DRAFT_247979, partial [Hesseltinella vesiculosa]